MRVPSSGIQALLQLRACREATAYVLLSSSLATLTSYGTRFHPLLTSLSSARPANAQCRGPSINAPMDEPMYSPLMPVGLWTSLQMCLVITRVRTSFSLEATSDKGPSETKKLKQVEEDALAASLQFEETYWALKQERAACPASVFRNERSAIAGRASP